MTHLEVAWLFQHQELPTLEEVKQGGRKVKLKFYGTYQQSTDILTKPLDTKRFQELREKLGVCDASKISLV
ncbi:hypothetical protein V2J09_010498 [Rumex salicifolius]